jgi:hypothetical protein
MSRKIDLQDKEQTVLPNIRVSYKDIAVLLAG